MRKGLTRAASGLLCGLLFCAVGCGTDQQDTWISKTLTTIDEVTSKLGQVRKYTQEAVTASEKAGEPIKGTDKSIPLATAAAEDVRKLGEQLQNVKERIDLIRDKTSADYRKELASRYRGRLEEKILSLQKEERELVVALADADARADREGKILVEKLRKTFKDGREAFEVLTKQR